jgi:hypothetical protein
MWWDIIILYKWPILLAAALIAFISVVVLLVAAEKKINKLKESYGSGVSVIRRDFVEQIENIKKHGKSNSVILDFIDRFSREFFADKLEVGGDLGYAEALELFKSRGRKKLSLFCENMISAKYSGHRVSDEQIDLLVDVFEAILADYEKKLINSFNDLIRETYYKQHSFIGSGLKFVSWFEKLFASKAEEADEVPAKVSDNLKQEVQQVVQQEAVREPGEIKFTPERIILKGFKMPSQKVLDNKYVNSIDHFDRIKERIDNYRKDSGADNLPDGLL